MFRFNNLICDETTIYKKPTFTGRDNQVSA